MNFKKLTLLLTTLCATTGAFAAVDGFGYTKANPADNATVTKLDKITVTFDVSWDGVDEATANGILTNAQGTKVAEYKPIPSTSGYDTIDYTLQGDAITPGEYTFTIPAGSVPEYGKSDTNKEIVLHYTVAEAVAKDITFTKVVPTEGVLDYSSVDGRKISPINLTPSVEYSSSMVFDKTKAVLKHDGKVVDFNINYSFYSMGYSDSVVLNDYDAANGEWTLELQEGFITDGASKSVAASYSWTQINMPEQGEVDTTPLELTYLTAYNAATGTSTDLLKGSFDLLPPGSDSYIQVKTNKDEKAGIYIMEIYEMEEGSSEWVNFVSMYNLRKDADGNFFYHGSNRDLKFLQGNKYEFRFSAIDTDNVAPEERQDLGNVTFTIDGTCEPYKYSPVTVESITPETTLDPSNDPNGIGELTSATQKIEMKFSAPVDIEAEINQGMGITIPLEDYYPNTNKTVWTFVVGESFLNQISADFNIIVRAKDKDGLVVKGNSGVEDTSNFMVYYSANFGGVELELIPASGEEVEKLYEFTAIDNTSVNGRRIGISLGLSAAAMPVLLSPSGKEVTRLDTKNYDYFYEDGTNVNDPANADRFDEEPAKVVFRLQKEVTAPGKYILSMPHGAMSYGSQFDGTPNRAAEFEYIIKGDPKWAGCTLMEGESLSSVNIIGWYVDAEVEAKENTNLNIEDEEGTVVAQLPVTVANTNGGSLVFADFSRSSEDGKPFAPEAGKTYYAGIAKGRIFLPGTDMELPKVEVTFTGAGTSAENCVSLTHIVAGHASAIASVAKGTKATVNLTPATNWELESVKLNGTDVTADVNGNVYTTPALQANSTLETVMKYSGTLNVTTGIDDVVTDFNLNVFSEGQRIVIRGLEAGMIVNLYTIEGAHLTTATAASSDDLGIEALAGTYVVTITKGSQTEAVKILNQ